MKEMGVGIIGTGIYMPEEVRTNDWFDQFDMYQFDDIFDKAGAKERRICAKGELASDIEAKALLAAVENTPGVNIEDIEFIINCPTVHEMVLPGHGSVVAYKAGANNAATLTTEGSCTALLSAITVAWGMINTRIYNTIACVVSCNWSICADYSEKSCMMMGDGAAAVIMQPVSLGKGVLAIDWETNGSMFGAMGITTRLPRNLITEYRHGNSGEGPRERPLFFLDPGHAGLESVKLDGPIKPPEKTRNALKKAGYTVEDIDFFLSHNPTKYHVEAWWKALNIPPEKTYITLEKYGNLGGASLAVNLCEANALGKIKDGDLVVLTSPGAGYHYIAAVLKWGK